ncbi:MAG TPA: ATP-binding cassette domain-containing protein [Chitinophagaceae bacterium]|nr:ATP-binding cassette domain-containing protein [Chitinophagaceae bacterium]
MQQASTIQNNGLKETVISVHNVYKAFGSLKVLNGINLEVERGENVVVLGKSGSGKSVLIKIISGLLKADKGDVQVLGQDMNMIKGKDLQKLRLKIGFSFQSSALYDSMTVRENLEFALVRNKPQMSRHEVDEAVKKVLNDVQLIKSIDQFPSELSGGQTKRIGIARTLILQPEIMLYDEPTAGLDPVTSMEINKLINQVQDEYKTTSIIITHDLTCAKVTGNRVLMLYEGKFLRQGSFKEVFDTTDERVKNFYDYNFITNP